jgi:hypothetical protein
MKELSSVIRLDDLDPAYDIDVDELESHFLVMR